MPDDGAAPGVGPVVALTYRAEPRSMRLLASGNPSQSGLCLG